MTAAPRISVVIAVEESKANLPAVLAHLAPAAHPDCEFLFCATDAQAMSLVPATLPQARKLVCASGSRIPHLWRDGIVAARAEWVALLSAHCVPASGWLDALLGQRFEGDEAALGGYFSNDAGATPRNWAIYLLRYAAFSRPLARRSVPHLLADNAAYRRSEVLACTDLVEDGFWEVEYHQRFRDKGLRLRLADDLEVVHINRYSARQFAAQRREHGFAFGRDRARRLGTGRLLVYAFATPLIPAVLYTKVLARMVRYRWVRSTPLAAYGWLLHFVSTWALAEARGLFDELVRRLSCAPWLGRSRPSP